MLSWAAAADTLLTHNKYRDTGLLPCLPSGLKLLIHRTVTFSKIYEKS